MIISSHFCNKQNYKYDEKNMNNIPNSTVSLINNERDHDETKTSNSSEQKNQMEMQGSTNMKKN